MTDPSRIFLSYRRADTQHVAGRLGDHLTEHFDEIFVDVDDIDPGVDYTEWIRQAVSQCDVLVALIGSRWVEAADENGRRRLDDPQDWVVEEIRTALQRNIRVIPVLVDDARMPDRSALPEEIAALVTRQSFRISHESFLADAGRLISAIKRSARSPFGVPKRHRKAALLGACALVLLVVAGIVLAVANFGGDPEKPRGTPASTPSVDGLPRAAAPLGAEVIVWPRLREGNWDIVTINADGSGEMQLTRSPQVDTIPIISPDRRTVMYVHRAGTEASLHVIAADGTGDRALFVSPPTGCRNSIGRPAWSRDQLLVLPCLDQATRVTSLKVVTLEGKILQVLDQGQLSDPAFSPDGKTVYYWRNNDPNQGRGGAIYQVPVDGSADPVPITPGQPGLDNDPTVSPSGSMLAIKRMAGGNSAIWSIGLDLAHTARQLSVNPNNDSDPAWSPDGRRIIFVRDGHLWLMDADGRNARPLTQGEDRASAPAWNSR